MTDELGFDPADIQALTFDCYGTLVDWLGGLRAAMAAMPSLAGCDADQLVLDRERDELDTIIGPYRPYREVLTISMAKAARRQGCEPTEAELYQFAESMGTWPTFEETHAALLRMRERYRLAILSNVDTAVLERSVQQFDVPVDVLVTAQEIHSYKPAHAHFEVALERLELPREKVLHVAQSLRHDIRPATQLGWNTAWVNRLGERLPEDLAPNLVVRSLTELADALGV